MPACGIIGMVLPEPHRIEYGEVVSAVQRADGCYEIDFRILKEGDAKFPKNGRPWLEDRRLMVEA
jgi:hypothetical protein